MSQPTDQGHAASAPGASIPPDSTDLFTYAHLALIAIFAVVVIVAIIAGVRLARKRRQAVREVEADNRLIDRTPPPAAPTAPVAAATPEMVDAPAAPLPTADAVTTAAAPATDDPAAGPVTQLKGLGPKLAQRLAELGVTTIGQIAALTDDEAAALDARLGTFAGRLHRDRWQEQARFLAAGDRKGFESVFGRL